MATETLEDLIALGNEGAPQEWLDHLNGQGIGEGHEGIGSEEIERKPPMKRNSNSAIRRITQKGAVVTRSSISQFTIQEDRGHPRAPLKRTASISDAKRTSAHPRIISLMTAIRFGRACQIMTPHGRSVTGQSTSEVSALRSARLEPSPRTRSTGSHGLCSTLWLRMESRQIALSVITMLTASIAQHTTSILRDGRLLGTG